LLKLAAAGVKDANTEDYVLQCQNDIEAYKTEVCEAAHNGNFTNSPSDTNEKTKCLAMPDENPYDSTHKICRIFSRGNAVAAENCYYEAAVDFDFGVEPNKGMDVCEKKFKTNIQKRNVCFEQAFERARRIFESVDPTKVKVATLDKIYAEINRYEPRQVRKAGPASKVKAGSTGKK
jgi:hypothetical protein